MAFKKKRIAKKKTTRKKPAKKKLTQKKFAKKKIIRKKIVKRKAIAKKKIKKAGVIGVITHYFPQVRAAVIKLKTPLSSGDNIKIKGHTTDFTQRVSSMQIEHVAINSAKKGQEIGLLVESRVRQHDTVYKA
jgi:putative protease